MDDDRFETTETDLVAARADVAARRAVHAGEGDGTVVAALDAALAEMDRAIDRVRRTVLLGEWTAERAADVIGESWATVIGTQEGPAVDVELPGGGRARVRPAALEVTSPGWTIEVRTPEGVVATRLAAHDDATLTKAFGLLLDGQ
jgi:hypothetical protein